MLVWHSQTRFARYGRVFARETVVFPLDALLADRTCMQVSYVRTHCCTVRTALPFARAHRCFRLATAARTRAHARATRPPAKAFVHARSSTRATRCRPASRRSLRTVLLAAACSRTDRDSRSRVEPCSRPGSHPGVRYTRVTASPYRPPPLPLALARKRPRTPTGSDEPF